MVMGKLLIIDDQEVNRSMLTSMFAEQYTCLEASNGKRAIEVLEKNKDEIELVLLDLLMPIMDGFGVLSYMKENDYLERIPVILITGEFSLESDSKAYDYGVADIVRKPFEPVIVLRRVKNVIELYQNKRDMQSRLEEQEKEIMQKNKELQENNQFLVDALSSVVEFRSIESGEHIKRIRYYTRILFDYLQKYYPEYHLTKDEIDSMVRAAALHDIGKIAISDSILLKPGKLTPGEFEIMKTHTILGCEILEQFTTNKENSFYKHCYEICRYHHERWDGNGYPDHLVGDEIPLSAQIMAIADVYDALISKRVYKEAYAPEYAYQIMNEGECGEFAPIALECFNLAKEDFIVMANRLSY